jgi:hypothetical protein
VAISKSPRLPPRARLWAVLYLAVGLLLVLPLVGQMMAGTPSRPASPSARPAPSGLEVVVAAAFDPTRCTTSVMVEQELRARLDNSGFRDWVVKSMATPNQCVTWSLAQLEGEQHTVMLLPTLSPEVRSGIDEVREETFVRCLTRDEVIDLVKTKLVSLGQTDFSIRTDGPFQVPLDRQDEVIAHFEAGCWMYSTYGWLDRRFTFYVSGKN